MGGEYLVQKNRYLIGSEDSAATLTNAYSGNLKVFATGRKYQLEFYVAYTPAESGPVCLVQLECGPEADDLYKVTVRRQLGGTDAGNHYSYPQVITIPKDITTVADTTYKHSFSEPVGSEYWRVSVKESGVSADYGTATIRMTVSGR